VRDVLTQRSATHAFDAIPGVCASHLDMNGGGPASSLHRLVCKHAHEAHEPGRGSNRVGVKGTPSAALISIIVTTTR